MNLGRTVFSQLIAFLPDREFRRCVAHYSGDYRPRGFSCWDQFLCMAFAQFTYRESLRDIEACLRSSPDKLYHMGIRGRISRSTLADANESHDWHIFADFAQVLICTGPRVVRSRSVWRGTSAQRLCPRLDDHRSMSGDVSPGLASASTRAR